MANQNPLLTSNRQAKQPGTEAFIPFARPDITEAEIDAVVAVLKSGWLTTGDRVKEFERLFAQHLGVGHARALNSGTAALHLALEAVGIGPEDDVIVPTYTFAASAEVIRYLGARPVLVDVRADDLNVSVDAVAAALTKRTRAIIGVDIGGQPCDWDSLRSLANPRGIILIDDAAHALPSRLKGRPVGHWADLTAFSFYATKTLTTGEGGMLVTDNEDWANRAETMSLHGISKDSWKRYAEGGSWEYDVVAAGYKYNMTDIAAALGLIQLRRLNEMTRRRTEIAACYSAAFAETGEVEVPPLREDRVSSWHLYILRLHLNDLTCDRAAFIRELTAQGIGTSVHFIPLHLHSYYREAYGFQPEDFPVAYHEYMRAVSLPIYSAMSDLDVERVIGVVQTTVSRSSRKL
jgi:perosamine synthetase